MKKYSNFIFEMKIAYQKELCSDIWKDFVIDEKIEGKLLRIAKDFFENLEFETEIIDIQLTGSIANYNYTASSDLDVHIIFDFSDVNEDTELVRKMVDGERFIWNMRHNIVIKGHDVELYVQDKLDELVATGVYSLMNHKWIKLPEYNPPDIDTINVDIKYDAMAYDIDELEKLSKSDLDPSEAETYYKKSKDLKFKISKARKEGLSKSGEFSIENLVFKKLRNEGKIEKLVDTKIALYDAIYSQ